MGNTGRYEVAVKVMALSDGRNDYFVSIRSGAREVTPHVFRQEYKAAYHVALYNWLLNGAEKPDLMAFDEGDWPAQATILPDPSPVPEAVAIQTLKWERVVGDVEVAESYKIDRMRPWLSDKPKKYFVQIARGSGFQCVGHGYLSAEAAKAAAQADHERRIRSAFCEAPSPEPQAPDRGSETYAAAEKAFTDYFVRNYPGPDTIIFDPKWHAPKLFAAAAAAIREATSAE